MHHRCFCYPQACLRAGQKASGHEADEKKQTPLILAVLAGSRAAVEKLLNAEAHVNSRNADGDTALHVAAFRGAHEVCELLIAAGADVNGPGELLNRPLHLAAAQHHLEAVAVLLAHGAKVRRSGGLPAASPVNPSFLCRAKQPPPRPADLCKECVWQHSHGPCGGS